VSGHSDRVRGMRRQESAMRRFLCRFVAEIFLFALMGRIELTSSNCNLQQMLTFGGVHFG
jgi:hypothetical protein